MINWDYIQERSKKAKEALSKQPKMSSEDMNKQYDRLAKPLEITQKESVNNYLMHTNSSVGEKATKAEKDYVRNQAKSMYDMTKETLKREGLLPQVDRKVEALGKDVVFKTGYHDGRYSKPVIILYRDFDCFGDKYKAPLVAYADNQYNYCGLTEESLRKYLQGYSFIDVGWAAAGGCLLVSEEIEMEKLANKLVHEPRTFELKILPNKKKK